MSETGAAVTPAAAATDPIAAARGKFGFGPTVKIEQRRSTRKNFRCRSQQVCEKHVNVLRIIDETVCRVKNSEETRLL